MYMYMYMYIYRYIHVQVYMYISVYVYVCNLMTGPRRSLSLKLSNTRHAGGEACVAAFFNVWPPPPFWPPKRLLITTVSYERGTLPSLALTFGVCAILARQRLSPPSPSSSASVLPLQVVKLSDASVSEPQIRARLGTTPPHPTKSALDFLITRSVNTFCLSHTRHLIVR